MHKRTGVSVASACLVWGLLLFVASVGSGLELPLGLGLHGGSSCSVSSTALSIADISEYIVLNQGCTIPKESTVDFVLQAPAFARNAGSLTVCFLSREEFQAYSYDPQRKCNGFTHSSPAFDSEGRLSASFQAFETDTYFVIAEVERGFRRFAPSAALRSPMEPSQSVKNEKSSVSVQFRPTVSSFKATGLSTNVVARDYLLLRLSSLIYDEIRDIDRYEDKVFHFSYDGLCTSWRLLQAFSILDTEGALFANPTLETIIVVFRGTASFTDGITDGRAWLSSCVYNDVSCGRVHAGFALAYSYVQKAIKDQIMNFSSELSGGAYNASFHMYFTGHSLGAGLATLAMVDLGSDPLIRPLIKDFSLTTFGSPRVGDATFASFFDSKFKSDATDKLPVMRYVNADPSGITRDPVSTVPPPWLGYMHVSPEYILRTNVSMYELDLHHVATYMMLLGDLAEHDVSLQCGNLCGESGIRSVHYIQAIPQTSCLAMQGSLVEYSVKLVAPRLRDQFTVCIFDRNEASQYAYHRTIPCGNVSSHEDRNPFPIDSKPKERSVTLGNALEISQAGEYRIFIENHNYFYADFLDIEYVVSFLDAHAPPSVPVDVTLAKASPSSVDIAWKAPLYWGRPSVVTKYRIRLLKDPAGSIVIKEDFAKPHSTSSRFLYRFSGLEENHAYFVSISAFNNGDYEGEASAPLRVHTADVSVVHNTGPSAEAENLQVIAVGATRVTIFGNHFSPDVQDVDAVVFSGSALDDKEVSDGCFVMSSSVDSIVCELNPQSMALHVGTLLAKVRTFGHESSKFSAIAKVVPSPVINGLDAVPTTIDVTADVLTIHGEHFKDASVAENPIIWIRGATLSQSLTEDLAAVECDLLRSSADHVECLVDGVLDESAHGGILEASVELFNFKTEFIPVATVVREDRTKCHGFVETDSRVCGIIEIPPGGATDGRRLQLATKSGDQVTVRVDDVVESAGEKRVVQVVFASEDRAGSASTVPKVYQNNHYREGLVHVLQDVISHAVSVNAAIVEGVVVHDAAKGSSSPNHGRPQLIVQFGVFDSCNIDSRSLIRTQSDLEVFAVQSHADGFAWTPIGLIDSSCSVGRDALDSHRLITLSCLSFNYSLFADLHLVAVHTAARTLRTYISDSLVLLPSDGSKIADVVIQYELDAPVFPRPLSAYMVALQPIKTSSASESSEEWIWVDGKEKSSKGSVTFEFVVPVSGKLMENGPACYSIQLMHSGEKEWIPIAAAGLLSLTLWKPLDASLTLPFVTASSTPNVAHVRLARFPLFVNPSSCFPFSHAVFAFGPDKSPVAESIPTQRVAFQGNQAFAVIDLQSLDKQTSPLVVRILDPVSGKSWVVSPASTLVPVLASDPSVMTFDSETRLLRFFTSVQNVQDLALRFLDNDVAEGPCAFVLDLPEGYAWGGECVARLRSDLSIQLEHLAVHSSVVSDKGADIAITATLRPGVLVLRHVDFQAIDLHVLDVPSSVQVSVHVEAAEAPRSNDSSSSSSSSNSDSDAGMSSLHLGSPVGVFVFVFFIALFACGIGFYGWWYWKMSRGDRYDREMMMTTLQSSVHYDRLRTDDHEEEYEDPVY
eukprot:ANDGO_06432.mRNA.1 Lipase